MPKQAMFRAGRNGSAIPVAPSPDLVADAGRLWEQHCKLCEHCLRGLPACTLGEKMYALYVWLADSEGK